MKTPIFACLHVACGFWGRWESLRGSLRERPFCHRQRPDGRPQAVPVRRQPYGPSTAEQRGFFPLKKTVISPEPDVCSREAFLIKTNRLAGESSSAGTSASLPARPPSFPRNRQRLPRNAKREGNQLVSLPFSGTASPGFPLGAAGRPLPRPYETRVAYLRRRATTTWFPLPSFRPLFPAPRQDQSIFSLKRVASQTIRPAVSRKKRVFPLTSGRAARCRHASLYACRDCGKSGSIRTATRYPSDG